MDIRPLMEDDEEEHSLVGNEECSIDDVGGEDNYEENMDDEDELNSERSPFLEAVNDTTAVQIKRRIGLVHAIAIVVGGIIGSGIFISPRYVVLHAGSMGETVKMDVWRCSESFGRTLLLRAWNIHREIWWRLYLLETRLRPLHWVLIQLS